MITIIVPVFNLQEYIQKCIDSLKEQTYADFEVILVDDGSTDSSVHVCEEAVRDDKRFRIITKENGGVSSARNCGLDSAKGDYITFVDGDDFCHPKMLETLINGFVNHKETVLSRCSYCESKKREYTDINIEQTCKIESSHDYIRDILLENADVGVWGGLFSRHGIGSIRFDCSIYHNEDKLFVCEYLLQNEGTVSICADKLYIYYMRRDSATHKEFSVKMLSMITANETLLREIQVNLPELKDEAEFNLENARLAVLKSLAVSPNRTEFKSEYKSIRDDLLNSKVRVFKLTNLLQRICLRIGFPLFRVNVILFRILRP